MRNTLAKPQHGRVLVPGGIRHARVPSLAPPNIAPAQLVIPVSMLSELYVENRKWKEVFLYLLVVAIRDGSGAALEIHLDLRAHR